MRILAIESADGSASMAYRDQRRDEQRHSGEIRDSLSWFIQQATQWQQQYFPNWSQLDALACCVGPGGFTGVRVAVAYAQGLSLANDIPCIAVNSLEAMAAQLPVEQFSPGQMLWLALDARMDELYVAGFRRNGDEFHPASELLLRSPQALQSELADDDVLAGPGFEAYAEHFDQTLMSGVQLDAGGVARAAAGKGLQHAVAAAELQPVYLRNKVAKTLKERGL